MLDLLCLLATAGNQFFPPPVYLEGLEVTPAIDTIPSQATGDGACVLTARVNAGRVVLGADAKDFRAQELTLVSTAAHYIQYDADGNLELDSGNAVWFAIVAFKHKSAGAISIRGVPGAIAAAASAAKPTETEIRAALGLDDYAFLCILGDIRFHRSADTTIVVKTTRERRTAYVESSHKTSYESDMAAQSSMAAEYWGHLEIPLTLASAFALNAGDLYANGISLPRFPYGGYLGAMEYIPAVAGAGAGGDMTLKMQIDGTEVTGSAMQLLLAATALGTKSTGGTPSAAHRFKTGDTLDIEVDAKPTSFSAGSGVIRVPIYKYVS